jgi:hypothetical protein
MLDRTNWRNNGFDRFISWLEAQPENSYQWDDCEDCLFARYARTLGVQLGEAWHSCIRTGVSPWQFTPKSVQATTAAGNLMSMRSPEQSVGKSDRRWWRRLACPSRLSRGRVRALGDGRRARA